ncbi:hypothetical protein [Halorubrum vacuolatum]|uniref:Uncharacterized protein n=1 Tax=Halorubrum vacuolatum TaxID=63740 RepID=A0A238Y0A1_HALVU|nr:hypothetical protein [Halorubrum vacuolatum]SNR64382.1 hypothetical protein SAMN06264855_12626 [Halorubrum vacuolatum]
MSQLVATIATVFIVVFAVGSLLLFFAGNHFAAGLLLTFLAFSIYFREINT